MINEYSTRKHTNLLPRQLLGAQRFAVRIDRRAHRDHAGHGFGGHHLEVDAVDGQLLACVRVGG
jgi:hypothetical protein